jgi:hypothetical protein
MANNIDWGQGAKNNNIGWGQGAKNNSIGWGISQSISPSGETEIYGVTSSHILAENNSILNTEDSNKLIIE